MLRAYRSSRAQYAKLHTEKCASVNRMLKNDTIVEQVLVAEDAIDFREWCSLCIDPHKMLDLQYRLGN